MENKFRDLDDVFQTLIKKTKKIKITEEGCFNL